MENVRGKEVERHVPRCCLCSFDHGVNSEVTQSMQMREAGGPHLPLNIYTSTILTSSTCSLAFASATLHFFTGRLHVVSFVPCFFEKTRVINLREGLEAYRVESSRSSSRGSKQASHSLLPRHLFIYTSSSNF